MNEKSCKWFVTDTFFKQSFIQMMTWVNMLMTDLMMNQHESIWINMKRKRSSSSQFDILYISNFEKDEQNTYENL